MEEENEFVLPGAVGSNQGKSKPLQEKELAEEDDSTLLEKVQEIPSALIDAATGEGQEIEFPEIPEASDMGGDAPGLIEGLIPNIKIFLARDDVGKSEIMEKSFKGDESNVTVTFDYRHSNLLIILSCQIINKIIIPIAVLRKTQRRNVGFCFIFRHINSL